MSTSPPFGTVLGKYLLAVNLDVMSSYFLVVLLFVGLVNGNIIIRTSQDVFFSAVIIDHTAMAHSSVVRQMLPIPSQNGAEYLSCGDDGRVVHTNVLM
mgnify:CR=1 FL=1